MTQNVTIWYSKLEHLEWFSGEYMENKQSLYLGAKFVICPLLTTKHDDI